VLGEGMDRCIVRQEGKPLHTWRDRDETRVGSFDRLFSRLTCIFVFVGSSL
jgi:hypothetical protein